MAPSTDGQLKDRIKRHQSYLVKMKAAKEKKNESSRAIVEHLQLVEKALQDLRSMEKKNGGSRGAQNQTGANPIDVRILTATFDKMRM